MSGEIFLVFHHHRWGDDPAPVIVRVGAIVSIRGDGDPLPASTRISLVNGETIEAVEPLDVVLETIREIAERDVT